VIAFINQREIQTIANSFGEYGGELEAAKACAKYKYA
jgi:hypothetical protein